MDINRLIQDAINSWDDDESIPDEQIDYQFIYGNEKIVFIKGGAGGSARGYQNKYIRMAERIHERLGATVISASNPDDPVCDRPDAEVIRRTASKIGCGDFELYFVGTSDGAYQSLGLAKEFPETKGILAINPSFIDVEGLKERLFDLPRVKKTLVFGSHDDDFDEVVPALRGCGCENMEIKIVEGADHRFTGMTDEFISLIDYL